MEKPNFVVESKYLDSHGLTKEEKPAVDSLVQAWGYDNLDHLVSANGYSSAREIAEEDFFTSVRDYFLGDGGEIRNAIFIKNMQNNRKKNL